MASQIDLRDVVAVRTWAHKLNITPEALAELVRRVGPSSQRVREELKRADVQRVGGRVPITSRSDGAYRADGEARPQAPLCSNCRRGPDGMVGHDDLYSQSMDAGQVQFKCRSCGHMWARLYRPQGAVEWTEPSPRFPGTFVPGRREDFS